MNDRKRAWMILHNEIRRRADGKDPDDGWVSQIGAILGEADSLHEVIIELAGFGATYALMGEPKKKINAHSGESLGIVIADPDRVKRVADQIGARVMQEPDEPDYDEEED